MNNLYEKFIKTTLNFSYSKTFIFLSVSLSRTAYLSPHLTSIPPYTEHIMQFLGIEYSEFKKFLDSRNNKNSNAKGEANTCSILDNLKLNQTSDDFIEIIDEDKEGYY